MGAIGELRQDAQSVAVLAHLGYPMYLNYIIGVAKILAVIFIWQKKWPTLREWAYAGILIDVTGAFFSFWAVDGLAAGMGLVMPVIFAVVTLVSHCSPKKMRAA